MDFEKQDLNKGPNEVANNSLHEFTAHDAPELMASKAADNYRELWVRHFLNELKSGRSQEEVESHPNFPKEQLDELDKMETMVGDTNVTRELFSAARQEAFEKFSHE